MDARLVLFWIATLILAGCETAPKSAPPELPLAPSSTKLSLEPNVIELGEIAPGSNNSFTAKLTNNSVRSIKIDQPVSSCGCASVNIDSTDLDPGQTVKISGIITGSTRAGGLSQSVTINSASEAGVTVILKIRGNVSPRILVAPGDLILSTDLNRVGKANALLFNKSDAEVLLRRSEGTDSGIKVEIDKTRLVPGEHTTINLTTTAPEIQDRAGEVVIYTNHPIEERIVIPYSIKSKENVACQPSAIRFGVVGRKEIVNKLYRILLQGEVLSRIKFSHVEIPPVFQLLGQPESEREGRLAVTLGVKDDVFGVISGRVTFFFFTDEKANARLSVVVPVSGLIRD
jgi:hypothetical protein